MLKEVSYLFFMYQIKLAIICIFNLVFQSKSCDKNNLLKN